MKKVAFLFLVLALSSTAWANTSKYIIIFADKSKSLCYILENDPPSKRLKIQPENSIKTDWISYHSVRAIIEGASQKDVTDEFILPFVKRVESRTTIGVDSSIYEYLAISFVASIIFYIIVLNN